MCKIILEAKNIYKFYNLGKKNPIKVLDNISLQVKKGEFICIMGPSGSGKTTLLNNLSTIDIPDKGTVIINNENVSLMNENKLCDFRIEIIGFIFQSFNLIDSLSNYDNISLPLYLRGVRDDKIKYKIDKITKDLKIAGIINKFPYECSGGENQRVAIARAIANEPEIIIADEPTGNLDSKNSYALLDTLRYLNQNGTTIIMVSHDPYIASYSSRMLYLKDGKIIYSLKKGNLSQKEYYYSISKMISKKAEFIFDKY